MQTPLPGRARDVGVGDANLVGTRQGPMQAKTAVSGVERAVQDLEWRLVFNAQGPVDSGASC